MPTRRGARHQPRWQASWAETNLPGRLFSRPLRSGHSQSTGVPRLSLSTPLVCILTGCCMCSKVAVAGTVSTWLSQPSQVDAFGADAAELRQALHVPANEVDVLARLGEGWDTRLATLKPGDPAFLGVATAW